MTPLDFIAFWHAQPFRPFRIHLNKDATAPTRELAIVQPLQIAMSPNMQTVMLALDDTAVSFKVEQVDRCEWIEVEDGDQNRVPGIGFRIPAAESRNPDPGTRSRPPLDPGTPVFMSFTSTDGHRLVQVSIDNSDGRSCFTTAGTRWDIHGLESFENGCSLYLHHLDNPTFEQRVIIWPSSNGTFETFAEALDFGALYTELKSRDRTFNAEPHDFVAPESYFKDIVPRPKHSNYRRNWWEKDEPGDADRFIIKLGIDEVGPHHWASAPRVIDTVTEDVLFDLWNTKWDLCGIGGSGPSPAEPTSDQPPTPPTSPAAPSEPSEPTIRMPPPWTFELRHFPEGREIVILTVDPKAKTASFKKNTPLPLAFFEQCLKNYSLFEKWEWLNAMLTRGPCPPTEPLYRHVLPGGYILELWPGPTSLSLPFVQCRVMEPGQSESTPGRVLLDLRGSVWSVDVRLWSNESKLILEFFTSDNQGRCEYTRHALILDLPSRRVTCERLEGSTSIGVLHNLAQKARNAEWFIEDITKSFAKGKSIPLP